MVGFTIEDTSFNEDVVLSFKTEKEFLKSDFHNSLFLNFNSDDKTELLKKVYEECHLLFGKK